jgi:hypothetical protein
LITVDDPASLPPDEPDDPELLLLPLEELPLLPELPELPELPLPEPELEPLLLPELLLEELLEPPLELWCRCSSMSADDDSPGADVPLDPQAIGMQPSVNTAALAAVLT